MMLARDKNLPNFTEYLDYLCESSYSIPGVNQTSQGGYELLVVDPTKNKIEKDPEKIFIFKQNDKSLGLSFIDKQGKEKDCFWIPKDAVDIIGSGDNLTLKIRPYTRWKNNPENSRNLDDFIEDFADSLESFKVWGTDKMKRHAQDDVELFLDLFDHNSPIRSFEKTGEHQWDAELEDGKIIEITKRNPDDLVATFKLYPNKNAYDPVLTILNSKENRKTIFSPDGSDKIETEGIVLGVKNQNPYISYLIKKSLGTETYGDKEALYSYFQSCVSKKTKDIGELKSMTKFLEEFIDPKEISSILRKSF